MKPNPSAYETILVPVDFSEPSRAALHQAHLLAGDDLARLVVLHVSEPVSAHWHIDLNRLQKEAHEAARQKLVAFIKEEFPKSAPRSHFMTGNPHDAIVKYAAKCNASLIVLGTHGRSGLSHLLMGSVSERVVRHAQCPVVVVPTRRT